MRGEKITSGLVKLVKYVKTKKCRMQNSINFITQQSKKKKRQNNANKKTIIMK